MIYEADIVLERFLKQVSDYQEFCDPSAREVLDKATKVAMYGNIGRLNVGTLVIGLIRSTALYNLTLSTNINAEDVARIYGLTPTVNTASILNPCITDAGLKVLKYAQIDALNRNQVLVSERNILESVKTSARQSQRGNNHIDPFFRLLHEVSTRR